ncbi:MAG TPA: HAMP domain-containing sensor histidine kinase [Longimicrobium sp.]|nr:HAMP domain-containing sensor histidine kinase [Longimicrobium sp.]
MPTNTFDGSNTLPAYRRLPAVAALLAAALGVLVLAGWVAGGEQLARIFPGRVPMLPETAAGLTVAGAALWLLRDGTGRRGRTAGLALAGVVAVLGAGLLVWGAARVDLGLGRFLFPEAVERYAGAGRRMGTNTALGLALVGMALPLAARETRRGWRASQLLAAACALVAFLALVGHVYGVRSLYTAGSVTGGMSLPTAVGLLLLGVGAFFARPGHGYAALVTGTDASGVLARQLLPAAIVVPVGLGYLWLHARREELLAREPAISLFAIVLVAVFSALVFRAAAAVADVDREREASLLRERRARADAEEANRAKMDFLAVMSHELRTPLNAIAGYAELMEMGIHGPVTEEQVAALGKIRRSQRHLLLLINDVLNFAKIEAGRLEVHTAEVEVRELVAGVETLILPQAEQRGLRYDRRMADESLRVLADPDKAGQVLLNLLSNAVKFTGAGGEVRLECGAASGRARLAVRDTGPGIPPERLESIFEPFVQLERGLAAQREGTGLGLAISRDLARAMGGDVWAESTPGKGSVFTLELPLAVPAPAPAPARAAERDAAPEERPALRHASGR